MKTRLRVAARPLDEDAPPAVPLASHISQMSYANSSTSSFHSHNPTPMTQRWMKTKQVLSKFSRFVGPGLMVSVAYMDPGNYATGVTAGASNRYSLLFFIFLANVIAIFLQSLCIKLGSVTGYDLARCSREFLPRKLNWVLWFLAECAIVATDVAEVIGSAIALNVLLRIPLPAGVCITVVDVLIVLAAYKADTASIKFVRYFECAVAVLVFAVVICFAVELGKIPTEGIITTRQVFRGFVPSKEMFQNGGLTIATSIIGSTVMIHSLFLGSGLVQPRLREYDMQHGLVNIYEEASRTDQDVVHETATEKSEKSSEIEAEYFYNLYRPSFQAINYSLKYSIWELAITLFTVALFVNAAIVIVAGATLYGTAEAVDADLYSIHRLLSKTIAPVVGTIFMLALLFSGQSAGIVCTIAGQIVSEGHIKWKLKPWMRRLVTRGISIVPCFIISMCIGKNGLSAALNVSQVVISILLPPLTAPLIYFTCMKKYMSVEMPGTDEAGEKKFKSYANNWVTSGFAVLIWIFISVLNVYAIVQMAMDGVQ